MKIVKQKNKPDKFDADGFGCMMKPQPGTYALILKAASSARVRIGRLGWMKIEPGYYIYVGSAFGPGGVRARVSRHLRKDRARHWHIDYLRESANPIGVWFSHAPKRLEHDWAKALANMPGMSSVSGFGCSDCACDSHLFWSAALPNLSRFAAVFGERMEWCLFLTAGEPVFLHLKNMSTTETAKQIDKNGFSLCSLGFNLFWER